MVRIAPVNLQFNPKTLWFDAGDFEIEVGKSLVVTTARGTEYGHLADTIFEATDEQVKQLKTALKPVLREATVEDDEKAQEMAALSKDAMTVFREMAEESAPEMRPISVEYLLDGDKAVFYFESEERVDFRELVRKLAAHFHVRVDMRQIGVRDEARMVGGLGHCGQELCCKRLGGEFCPVSIRMAKEQDLSLNPQKISGVCGRLMCCLRYEFDAYKDFKSRSPKVGATIHTPAGDAKVVDLDVPREVVTVKLGDEKPVKVPLADFEPSEEGQARPNTVGDEAWDRANADDVFDGVSAALVSFSHKDLSDGDKLAKPVAVSRKSADSAPSEEKAARKPRRRRSTKLGADDSRTVTRSQQADDSSEKASSKTSSKTKSRSNRNSQSGKPQSSKSKKTAKAQSAKSEQNSSSKQGRPSGGADSLVRPGQRSSALRRSRNADASSSKDRGSQQSKNNSGESTTHRRSRRRSHTSRGGSASSDKANE